MGTRGLTGFVANGKWYAMYNHFDSYPEELGMRVLEFCKTIEEWDAVKERVEKIELVDDGNSMPSPELIDEYKSYGVTHISGVRVNRGTLESWYNLLHELQGEAILYAVANGNARHMIDDHLFLGDSLFCEWAYIIDLDDMTLKVYKGFNKELKTDTPLPPDIDPTKYDEQTYKNINEKYYPVKMLHAYRLNRLPEFMLGVTNEFKKQYREEHRDTLAEALRKLK